MKPRLERPVPPHGCSFITFIREQSIFPFAWHYHADWELTFIERGSGILQVGDGIEAYAAGNVCLIGPDLPHTWQAPEHPAGHRAVVIQFSGAVLDSLCEFPEGGELRRLLDKGRRGVAFDLTPNDPLAAMLRALPTGTPLQRLGRLMSALALLATMLNRGRTLSGPHRVARLDRDREDRFDGIRRTLEQHLDEPLLESSFARQVGMTQTAFSRFFKRTTGHTFVAYRQQLRVARACQQLSETDAEITSIAFAVGFGNLSHFNHTFRKLKGMTPRAYRLRFRRAGDD